MWYERKVLKWSQKCRQGAWSVLEKRNTECSGGAQMPKWTTCAKLVMIGAEMLLKFCTRAKKKKRKFTIQWCALCAPLIFRTCHNFSHIGGEYSSICAIFVPIRAMPLFKICFKSEETENVTFNGAHWANLWSSGGTTLSVKFGNVGSSICVIFVPIRALQLFTICIKAQRYKNLTSNGAHHAHH